MGLEKVGFNLIQRIGKTAINYADDVSFVRRCKKPDLNGLHFVPHPVGDTFKFQNDVFKTYLDNINKIKVKGLSKEEIPIYDLLKKSMFDAQIKTNGRVKLPNEIRFEYHRNNGIIRKEAVASASRDNILYVNKDYFENIDENIVKDLGVFIKNGYITKDPDVKYKIVDWLRTTESEYFENILNKYDKNMPLIDKLNLHRTGIVGYANLTYQANQAPLAMIENILSNSAKKQILSNKGVLKPIEEIQKMARKEQFSYLQKIASITPPSAETAMIQKPTSLFVHELGHLSHYQNITLEEHLQLQNKLSFIWRMSPKTGDFASKVSGYAATSPIEFVAEVYSGLVHGQKFSDDVMKMYKSLKGPVVI